MARPKVNPRNEQRRFEIDELFFSTTDRAGVILSGNEVFRRVAAFESVEELIGKPHNVIRHPDMPRAVFKLLWDTIGDGQPIVAYVKNLAQDGRYYWVMAYVVPVECGYLSVRFKPSSPIQGIVEGLYKQLSEIEAEAEGQPGLRAEAMERSGQKLGEALASLGFEDYEAFMRAAMVAEMASRSKLIAEKGTSYQPSLRRGALADAHEREHRKEVILDRMFDRSQEILNFIGKLEEGAHLLEDLAKGTHLLAMNALVACKRMGTSASGLSVVAQELSRVAQTSGGLIREMTENLHSFVGALHGTAFRISAAKLQVGISLVFLAELACEKGHSGDGFTHRHVSDLELLSHSLNGAIQDIEGSMVGLQSPVAPLKLRLDDLEHVGKSMACVYHMGQVEAAVSGEAERFRQLLTSLGKQVSDIRPVVEGVRSGIDSVLNLLPAMQEDADQLVALERRNPTLICRDGAIVELEWGLELVA